MMKKFLLIFLLFSGYAVSAEQENNPFFENEHNNTKTEVKTENSYKETAKGPGNPDTDPDLPIDDYIPFLLITAVAMISYKTYRKRNVIS